MVAVDKIGVIAAFDARQERVARRLDGQLVPAHMGDFRIRQVGLDRHHLARNPIEAGVVPVLQPAGRH